jgi:glycoprotein endo-alpha-1,2-mannosidase
MKWIRQSGIGVLVISWYPPDLSKFLYKFYKLYREKMKIRKKKEKNKTGFNAPNISFTGDKEGKPFDQLFPMFLDSARIYGLKISFHIEPYEG